MCSRVCRACNQNLESGSARWDMLAEALRLFRPFLPSVARVKNKTDSTLFLSVDTRSRFISSSASRKTKRESIRRIGCHYYHNNRALKGFLVSHLNFSLMLICIFYHSAICGWRNLRQPASVRAEKYHHRVPVLRGERHLPTRQLHQHTRAAVHEHEHPVHPHQPLQSLKGTFPSRPNGTSPDYSPPDPYAH